MHKTQMLDSLNQDTLLKIGVLLAEEGSLRDYPNFFPCERQCHVA